MCLYVVYCAGVLGTPSYAVCSGLFCIYRKSWGLRGGLAACLGSHWTAEV